MLVHGYHLGVDDSEIFVPAIKHAADPALYPFGSEFFMAHAHFSLFPALVGHSAGWLHLPIDFVIFSWHVGCIFLLLLAAWKLLGACFLDDAARWSGVALLAATLSVPVAGTALVIMDPYVTARSLSTPMTVLARRVLHLEQAAAGRRLADRHRIDSSPDERVRGRFSRRPVAGPPAPSARRPGRRADARVPRRPSLPLRIAARPRPRARSAALAHLLLRLELGLVRVGRRFRAARTRLVGSSKKLRNTTPAFRSLLGISVPFGLLFTLAGVILSSSPRLENFTRLQPMRALHIVYIVFFVMLGGCLGEYALRRSAWRWLCLFLPLAASMFFLQQSQFPNSAHVELPGYRYHNAWNSAFFWIRGHTPKDAVFALDPNYMKIAGDDQHGFRAVAERSALADAVKDSGAVSLFPQLADDWKNEVQAQSGWDHIDRRGFQRLAKAYPVTWILTWSPGPAGMACPYQNEGLSVCRIDTPIAFSADRAPDSARRSPTARA